MTTATDLAAALLRDVKRHYDANAERVMLETDVLAALSRAPDPALFAEVVEALRALHHTVCGETGFAYCVRLDSGKAYPWPALDAADEASRAVLAKIGGAK